MRRTTRIGILLALALSTASGCAHRAPMTSSRASEPAPRGGPAAADPSRASDAPVPATRDAAEFSLSTVYFGYDSAELDPASRTQLATDAKRLRERGDLHVLIEGHCDERGTEAYNLALGERRAQSVERFLVQAGIPASRLRVISYGKERPASDERGEQAWALNRRAQLNSSVR